MGKRLQLRGRTFGRLLVLRSNGVTKRNNVLWFVQCTCGNRFETESHSLIRGNTTQCDPCRLKQLQRNNCKPDSALRQLYAQYKCQARNAKRSFELTLAQFEALTSCSCFYTGRPPKQIKKTPGSDYKYNGIDRLDNTKGYTVDNSVPCHGIINKMKGVLSSEVFIAICKEVAKHHG